MPLEDLTGAKYINSLNEAWPLGTDLPDAGDDHLRGIKNVLKNTFPNFSGAITRTHTQINNGSVPAGSVLAFYNAAAPTGWTRVAGLLATSMLRIVASASAGGTFGGSDDPVLNDKVPSHIHPFSATTGIQSQGHGHYVSGNTAFAGDHTHNVPNLPGPAGTGIASGSGWVPSTVPTGSAGSHSHSLNILSQNETANHTHAMTGDTSAPTGAANWTPRYLDCILCVKS